MTVMISTEKRQSMWDEFFSELLCRKHYANLHVTFLNFDLCHVISDSLYCDWSRFCQINSQTIIQNEWEIRFIPTHQFLRTV